MFGERKLADSEFFKVLISVIFLFLCYYFFI